MPLRHANDRECLLPVAPQAEKKIFTSIAVKVPLWRRRHLNPIPVPHFLAKISIMS